MEQRDRNDSQSANSPILELVILNLHAVSLEVEATWRKMDYFGLPIVQLLIFCDYITIV